MTPGKSKITILMHSKIAKFSTISFKESLFSGNPSINRIIRLLTLYPRSIKSKIFFKPHLNKNKSNLQFKLKIILQKQTLINSLMILPLIKNSNLKKYIKKHKNHLLTKSKLTFNNNNKKNKNNILFFSHSLTLHH
jgi:hypothetical protein